MHPQLALVSDGVGQFATRRHGACWVHAERLVHRLVPGCDEHRLEQQHVPEQVWALYKRLKAYKASPMRDLVRALRVDFDALFTQKVGFQALTDQLERLHTRNDELLLVLERPDVPLHTNQSETDIRDFVKKRKVSAGTRGELGRQCRSAFATLLKTCRKLDTSFWGYLLDCLEQTKQILALPKLIEARSAAR